MTSRRRHCECRTGSVSSGSDGEENEAFTTPHPNPLPQGERGRISSGRSLTGPRLFPPPLAGEGWGEGEKWLGALRELLASEAWQSIHQTGACSTQWIATSRLLSRMFIESISNRTQSLRAKRGNPVMTRARSATFDSRRFGDVYWFATLRSQETPKGSHPAPSHFSPSP